MTPTWRLRSPSTSEFAVSKDEQRSETCNFESGRDAAGVASIACVGEGSTARARAGTAPPDTRSPRTASFGKMPQPQRVDRRAATSPSSPAFARPQAWPYKTASAPRELKTMRLVSTPFNPTPPGAVIHPCARPTACCCAPRAGRGRTACAARWRSFRPSRVHREILRDDPQPTRPWPFGDDLDGTARAARRATQKSPQRAHRRFLALRARLLAFADLLEAFCPKPWFGLAIRWARRSRWRWRAPAAAARAVGALLADDRARRRDMAARRAHLGRSARRGWTRWGVLAPRRSKIVATLPFEDNQLTSDPVRYARTAASSRPTLNSASAIRPSAGSTPPSG